MNSVVKKISFVVLIGLAVFFLFFFDSYFSLMGERMLNKKRSVMLKVLVDF